MQKIISVLSELIRLKTDEKNVSNKPILDFIKETAEKHQVLCQIVKNRRLPVASILIGINMDTFENETADILLSGHLDTVPATTADWETDPLTLTQKGDKLLGLGTADMKGFIAVCLAKIPEIKATKKKVILAFSSDEETTSYTVRDILWYLKKQNTTFKYALIGEPTSSSVCLSHSGYIGFTTKIKGIAGHSSDPSCGVNALYVAARLVTFLEQMNRLYENSATTLNVGILSGGKGRNVIAPNAFIDWEIRFKDTLKKEQLLTEISAFHHALEKEYQGATVQMKEKESLPVFEQKRSLFTALCQEVFESPVSTLSYTTEAGFFKETGAETVVLGFADETLAHKPNEHIFTSDAQLYAKKLILLLEKI